MCSPETDLRQSSCASDLLRKCFWAYREKLEEDGKCGEQSQGSSFRQSPAEGSLSLILQGARKWKFYPLGGKGVTPVSLWLRAAPAEGSRKQAQAFPAAPSKWMKPFSQRAGGWCHRWGPKNPAVGTSRNVQVLGGIPGGGAQGCDKVRSENI